MEKPTLNGLMWSKVADNEMTWDEAMRYAKNLREGGYDDWRLPTISELQNVFDYEKGEAKIDFLADYFWSSTEYCKISDLAWYIGLHRGSTNPSAKATDYVVRCVREVEEGD